MASNLSDLKWVRKLDPLIFTLDEKPQFGSGSFPLKELEQSLSQTFGVDLHLKISEEGFLLLDETLKGIEEKKILEIFFTPISEPIYFVTSVSDLKEITWTLLEGENGSSFVQDPYSQAVTKFFAIEVLSKLNALGFSQDLIARLGSFLDDIPKGPYFAINISLEMRGKTFWGRLLISDGFRNVWKKHFYSSSKKVITKDKAEKINVEIALVGGKSQLSQKEWEKASVGDVILLDYSSLDVGKVALTLNQETLFRGKLLSDGIKILEYPLYEEVMGTMDDNQSDENLYGDLDKEDDEFLSEEEEEEEPLAPLPFEKVEEKPQKESPRELPLEKIPIQLTVEVGRVGMSLNDLMNLAPGNVIDIKVEPERGVDLVVNGKKVGRGELVKLGQVLGVRILEL